MASSSAPPGRSNGATTTGFLFAKCGHGKRQTLRALTASLLDQDGALFIIDGNGALIENLDRIKSIQDRLVILDPSDVPALKLPIRS